MHAKLLLLIVLAATVQMERRRKAMDVLDLGL